MASCCSQFLIITYQVVMCVCTYTSAACFFYWPVMSTLSHNVSFERCSAVNDFIEQANIIDRMKTTLVFLFDQVKHALTVTCSSLQQQKPQ